MGKSDTKKIMIVKRNGNLEEFEPLKIKNAVISSAERVMVDLSEGEVNIDELQNILNEEFGKGAFEITPEILLNESSKIAGIETVINQINKRTSSE